MARDSPFIEYLLVVINLKDNIGMAESKIEKATLAGGCFWCMERPFKELDGVLEVVSGYSGGHVEDPTYDEVCSGETGHYEAVQITYNPGEVSFNKLLDVFWRQIDPTDPGGQFCDRGPQYRSAIFYHSKEQEQTARQSAWDISAHFGKPITTKIIEFKNFYPAEDYHQDFRSKCPMRYKSYRIMSGRDRFLQQTWGKDK